MAFDNNGRHTQRYHRDMNELGQGAYGRDARSSADTLFITTPPALRVNNPVGQLEIRLQPRLARSRSGPGHIT